MYTDRKDNHTDHERRGHVTEEHLRYIGPNLPKQLLAIDPWAYFLETQHGCQISGQEKKMHCTWLPQPRGEIVLLLAKKGGQDDNNGIDQDTLQDTLTSLPSDMEQTLSEMETELSALDLRQEGHSVVFFEKLNVLWKWLERVADQEIERALPCLVVGY